MNIYSIERYSYNEHAEKIMRLGNSSRISSTVRPMRWKEIMRFSDSSDSALGTFNKCGGAGKFRLVETYTGAVICTKDVPNAKLTGRGLDAKQ